MNNFNYCPQCSSKDFQIENLHRFECRNCDLVFYHNIAAAVAVIIERNNHILFTKRSVNPKKGMLDLPGGFTDPEETAEETCVRELQEELDLHFETADFKYFTSQPNLYKFGNTTYRTEDLIFTAQLPKNADIKLEVGEIEAVEWIEKSQINLEEVAFKSLRTALKTYLTQ